MKLTVDAKNQVFSFEIFVPGAHTAQELGELIGAIATNLMPGPDPNVPTEDPAEDYSAGENTEDPYDLDTQDATGPGEEANRCNCPMCLSERERGDGPPFGFILNSVFVDPSRR